MSDLQKEIRGWSDEKLIDSLHGDYTTFVESIVNQEALRRILIKLKNLEPATVYKTGYTDEP